jgi:hypothetical protein
LVIRIFITNSFREVLHNVIPQHFHYQWLSHLKKKYIYTHTYTHMYICTHIHFALLIAYTMLPDYSTAGPKFLFKCYELT